MNNHQREIERASMRYFIGLATNGRADILKEIDVDYARFLAAIRMAYEAEKNLPSEELLNKRLCVSGESVSVRKNTGPS